MKKILTVFLFVVFLFTVFVELSHAFIIVDTGVPTKIAGGNDIASYQSLAVKFSLTQTTVVTDLRGWIGHVTDGLLTYAIYTNDNDVPSGFGASDDLYNQSLFIQADSNTDAWQGLSGLNWSLDIGDYWFSLEVRGDSSYNGIMWTPAPNNGSYAVGTRDFAYSLSNGQWVSGPFPMGFQIESNSGSV